MLNRDCESALVSIDLGEILFRGLRKSDFKGLAFSTWESEKYQVFFLCKFEFCTGDHSMWMFPQQNLLNI
jgi:hypothetical protein